jgi:hypothetical protein
MVPALIEASALSLVEPAGHSAGIEHGILSLAPGQ